MEDYELKCLMDLALSASGVGQLTSAMLIKKAHAEIERLRASQFRWIPVGESKPPVGDNVFHAHHGTVSVGSFFGAMALGTTHWAPIPPLPEKSQADRDDEMLRAWIKSIGAEHTDRENSLRIGYLEGLKAAREQKTP